jgi:hypothetical protein
LDKAIITAFLIIAGVVTAVLIFNAIYPAAVQGSDAMAKMEERIGERMRSQVDIVHVAESGSYTDVALVWVKNVGSTSIRSIERCDVFFGPEGNFSRIPYGVGTAHWEYDFENDSDWKPTATLKVTIDLDYNLVSGERYFVKFVAPNGVSDTHYFSK